LTPKVNLLLLDDHTLFREMLVRFLNTDTTFQIVGHSSSLQEGLDVLSRHSIDLVVLDYDLGKQETGFHFVSRARESGFKGKILIVTAGMTDANYVRALGLGVCGILLKHSSPELLIEAIHKVLSGETSIDARCVRALVAAIEQQSSPKRSHDLTGRERAVLKGLFAGLSNKEIGASLNISEASVKSAMQQLFLKNGVRTRAQLVRIALEDYNAMWDVKL
jgi:DNA-binding NarL/FixJ family response regulator